jgi:hypothetical protein
MATKGARGKPKERIAIDTLAMFERSTALLDEFDRNPRSSIFASTTTEASESTENSESTESCEHSENSENKENKEGTEASEVSETSENSENTESSEDTESSENTESSESTEDKETMADAILAPLSDPLPADLTAQAGEFGPIVKRIATWKKKNKS